ncbi:alpha/beta fold hydrolase [Alcaligenaceae bacterium]|nr:alpha/beta fold hydrolase [Alcaligenaceae bacterium]
MQQLTSAPVSCAHIQRGEGPPLVLVHGIGARKESWSSVIQILKEDFQCIAYDLRGHGESPLPSTAFELDDLVEDLEALRAKLGLERMHVMGHSLGGMIGPAYARKYSERILSLGLLSTAAFRTAEDRQKVSSIVQAMEKKGVAPMLDTLVERWFTDGFKAENQDTVQWRREQVLTTDETVFLNVFRIYAETEMSPWLHEIKASTLVCTGEMDGGCNPRLNRQISDAMPNAELVILQGLKHAIQLEAPNELASAMKDFLQNLESPVQ